MSGRCLSSLLILGVFLWSSPLVWGQQRFTSRPRAVAGDCTTSTCLTLMDFEGSGCADGDSGGEGDRTCTLINSPEPDCTATEHADCPLEQSFSGFLDTAAETIHNDTLVARTTGVDTLDFIFRVVAAPSSGTQDFIGFISANSPNFECRAEVNTGGQVRAQPNLGSSSSNIATSLNTTYWARLNYDLGGDDCRLLVWSDDWGGTSVGDVTANGTSTGVSVIGWAVDVSASGGDYIVDDIAMCDDDYTTGSTSCHD